MPEPHFSPTRSRFFRAYFVTASIFLRYFRLILLKKILSEPRIASKRLKAHQKTAQQLKTNILILKGVFIKVGQMISIMTHFLPEPITRELEGLQDSVPPAAYPEIEARFREEFGRSPKEYFAEFEERPIASASLGQVHAARLASGEKLAVKVQYPGIEEVVQHDLKILKRICTLIGWVFPQYDLRKTYQEIREVILEELDFQNEGRNLELLEKNLENQTGLKFPKVYWEHSTQRVLGLEFMEGVKISHVEELKRLGVDPTEVAQHIVHLYCQQIFIDGVYHADPHPGNFLVQATASADDDLVHPTVVMMDFGAIARISEPMRQGIAKFMSGVIKRDTAVISQSMKDMGFIAKNQDEALFDNIVEFFYERLKDVKIEEIQNLKLQNLGSVGDWMEFRRLEISIQDLFRAFHVPKEWALLERTLILLVGLTTHLDPKFDPMSIIIPYAERFVLGKDRTFADVMIETLREVGLSYLKLPAELEKTLARLNRGELQLSTPLLRQGADKISRSLHRLTLALLGLGGLSFSYLLQSSGNVHYEWGYALSGSVLLWLFIHFLKK